MEVLNLWLSFFGENIFYHTGHSKSSLRSSVEMTPCIPALFINAAMVALDSKKGLVKKVDNGE